MTEIYLRERTKFYQLKGNTSFGKKRKRRSGDERKFEKRTESPGNESTV